MKTKITTISNIEKKSRYLTEFEKGQISSLKIQGKGVRQIARELNRNTSSITRYLKNINTNKIEKKTEEERKF